MNAIRNFGGVRYFGGVFGGVGRECFGGQMSGWCKFARDFQLKS